MCKIEIFEGKGPYFNYVSTFLSIFDQLSTVVGMFTTYIESIYLDMYSVIHISIHPSKELCSKMAPGEVGVSLP